MGCVIDYGHDFMAALMRTIKWSETGERGRAQQQQHKKHIKIESEKRNMKRKREKNTSQRNIISWHSRKV